MDQYRHHVSGFFAHRAEAEGAVSTLVGRGLGRDRLQLFDADSGPAISEPKGESNEVLTNVLFDGAIGTAVGTGIGALAQLAIVAGGVSLFVASPLVAPLIRDAIASGQVVLVVQTRMAEETEIAREVIGAAVGEFKDVASKV